MSTEQCTVFGQDHLAYAVAHLVLSHETTGEAHWDLLHDETLPGSGQLSSVFPTPANSGLV